MALYLVQHGKALDKDVDPERSLSQEGVAEVRRIAEVAKGYNVSVSVIEHSGVKRAVQTAELFAAALTPRDGVSQRSDINPMDAVAPVAQQMQAGADVMLVGHLPFMSKLTSYLVVGSDSVRIFRFQNGGIVCLDQDIESNSWFIKWALMPKID